MDWNVIMEVANKGGLAAVGLAFIVALFRYAPKFITNITEAIREVGLMNKEAATLHRDGTDQAIKQLDAWHTNQITASDTRFVQQQEVQTRLLEATFNLSSDVRDIKSKVYDLHTRSRQ